MNMKKIIPLSFAVLSVAGTLSACSDSSVSGADVQGNSIALSSSSVVGPGSSSSIITEYIGIETLAKGAVLALVRENGSHTAKTASHVPGEPLPSGSINFLRYSDYPIDSVNAHESFNNATQAIYDAGAVVHPLKEDSVARDLPVCKIVNFDISDETTKQNVSPEDYEACVAVEEYISKEVQKDAFAVMKDEDGLIHGPIVSESQYVGYPESLRNVYCLGSVSGLFMYHVGYVNPGQDHHRLLRTVDSAMAEEFKNDCASENGEFTEKNNSGYYELFCGFQYTMTSDSVLTYSDPYWEKYAKHVVDNCVFNIEDEEFRYKAIYGYDGSYFE